MNHDHHVPVGVILTNILEKNKEHPNVLRLIGQCRIAQQGNVGKVRLFILQSPLLIRQMAVDCWISQLFGKHLARTGRVQPLVILSRIYVREGHLSSTTIHTGVRQLGTGPVLPFQEVAQLVPRIVLLGQIHDEQLISDGGMLLEIFHDFGIVPLVGLHPNLVYVAAAVHELVEALDALGDGATPLVVLVVVQVRSEGIKPYLRRRSHGQNEFGVGIGGVKLAVVGSRGDVPHRIDVVVLAGEVEGGIRTRHEQFLTIVVHKVNEGGVVMEGVVAQHFHGGRQGGGTGLGQADTKDLGPSSHLLGLHV